MSKVKVTKDGLFVPIELADAITLETLKEVHSRMKEEVEKYFHIGEWMHPDDVTYNQETIPMLERLITYFGGDFE